MKIQNCILISVLTLSSFCHLVFAETYRTELGSGNITPCSRATNSGRSIFGDLISDSIVTAEQRVTAYAVVEAPTLPGIQNDIQQCAVQGAAAAGISAILASPAAAMPAFQGQFQSCLQDRAKQYFSISLELSEGQCMW